jgi:predicted acylesterase/phospholipase RssA
MKINDVIRSINETATAGGTSAGAIAGSGFAMGIGSTERATNPTKKKKIKSKLIKR